MAGKISQAFGFMASSQVLGRCTEYAPAASEMMRYDVVFTHVSDADIDVDLLIDQIHGSIQYLEVDLQSRMHLDQFGQHRRHVVSSEPGTRRYPQSSPYLGLRLFQRAFELFVDIEHTLSPGQHQFAAFGHGHVPGGAVK